MIFFSSFGETRKLYETMAPKGKKTERVGQSQVEKCKIKREKQRGRMRYLATSTRNGEGTKERKYEEGQKCPSYSVV